jgi:hypothetical protein
MRESLDMRANIAARGHGNNQRATKCGSARTNGGCARIDRCTYLPAARLRFEIRDLDRETIPAMRLTSDPSLFGGFADTCFCRSAHWREPDC